MRYEIYDVFAETAFGGNPLAIVHDGLGLGDERMQSIARSFNLSETVFLRPAADGATSADVRIFTPAVELPFAGHPTVGAAIAVARERGMDTVGQGIVVLGQRVGPVRCGVRFDRDVAHAEFDLPKLAERVRDAPERATLANALGVAEERVGFENHTPACWSGGVEFTLVPVLDLATVQNARPDKVSDLGEDGHTYVYTRETLSGSPGFHARMFAPGFGIPEDPATGSAVAALAGAIVAHDHPIDGEHTLLIEQGFEMNRPSIIELTLDVQDGRLVGGRIGGQVRRFASGELDLSE